MQHPACDPQIEPDHCIAATTNGPLLARKVAQSSPRSTHSAPGPLRPKPAPSLPATDTGTPFRIALTSLSVILCFGFSETVMGHAAQVAGKVVDEAIDVQIRRTT